MLNPDHRRLYTDALRPPPGYRFGEAVAATYSLSLETLLTIPLHLALFSADEPLEELLRDGVALLESLRRTTDTSRSGGRGGGADFVGAGDHERGDSGRSITCAAPSVEPHYAEDCRFRTASLVPNLRVG